MAKILALLLFSTFCLKLVLSDALIAARSSVQCYKCSGIECSRPTLVNQTTTCADPLDSCVTVFEEYSVAARGCYLEVPDKYRVKCQETGNLECDRCFGTLCNKYARADIRCLECDSSKDSKCLQNPSQMKAVRCPLLPTANSYCFVEYDEHSTIRGCMDNLRDEISCYDSQNCQLCLPAQDGGACNAFEFPSGRRQCLACSGDQCTSGSNNQTSAYCMKSGDQCVSMQMNGRVIKGCLQDLDQSQITFCNANPKSCTKCNSNFCNTITYNQNDGSGSGGTGNGGGGSGGAESTVTAKTQLIMLTLCLVLLKCL